MSVIVIIGTCYVLAVTRLRSPCKRAKKFHKINTRKEPFHFWRQGASPTLELRDFLPALVRAYPRKFQTRFLLPPNTTIFCPLGFFGLPSRNFRARETTSFANVRGTVSRIGKSAPSCRWETGRLLIRRNFAKRSVDPSILCKLYANMYWCFLFFAITGYTSGHWQRKGELQKLAQEHRRSLETFGQEEAWARSLHDTARVEASTEADLRLLKFSLPIIITVL